jgi:hypothetical protein
LPRATKIPFDTRVFCIITWNLRDCKTKDVAIQTAKEFVKTNAALFGDKYRMK